MNLPFDFGHTTSQVDLWAVCFLAATFQSLGELPAVAAPMRLHIPSFSDGTGMLTLCKVILGRSCYARQSILHLQKFSRQILSQIRNIRENIVFKLTFTTLTYIGRWFYNRISNNQNLTSNDLNSNYFYRFLIILWCFFKALISVSVRLLTSRVGLLEPSPSSSSLLAKEFCTIGGTTPLLVGKSGLGLKTIFGLVGDTWNTFEWHRHIFFIAAFKVVDIFIMDKETYIVISS